MSTIFFFSSLLCLSMYAGKDKTRHVDKGYKAAFANDYAPSTLRKSFHHIKGSPSLPYAGLQTNDCSSWIDPRGKIWSLSIIALSAI
jgi:hypothetical protein